MAGVGAVGAGVVGPLVAVTAACAGISASAEGSIAARLTCVPAFAPVGTEMASAESAAVSLTRSIVVVPSSTVVVVPISGSGAGEG